MHLQQQMASRLGNMTNGRGEFQWRSPWNPPTKQELLDGHAVIPEAFVTGVGVGCVKGLRLRNDRRVVGVADERVVVDRVVAWSHFHRGDFRGLCESSGNDEDLVLILHVACMREGFRHAQHEVGLANLTALGEIREAGVVGRISFRHSVGNPRADECLLVVGQKPLSTQRAVVVVRGPRRHVVRLGDVLNEVAVSRHFRVGGKRHRTDFTRAVTFGALGVDDRRDVGVEGDGGLGDQRA